MVRRRQGPLFSDLRTSHLPARLHQQRPLRPGRPDDSLQRRLGRDAIPDLLDAPGGSGIHGSAPAERGASVRFVARRNGHPSRAEDRLQPLHPPRDSGGRAAFGRISPRGPARRAVCRLGARWKGPRGGPTGRRTSAAGIPARPTGVRELGLDSVAARVSHREAESSSTKGCLTTATRFPSSTLRTARPCSAPSGRTGGAPRGRRTATRSGFRQPTTRRRRHPSSLSTSRAGSA